MAEIHNAFGYCRRLLLARLKEPAAGCIQLLTGPRQVRKTTLLREIAAQFRDGADSPQASYRPAVILIDTYSAAGLQPIGGQENINRRMEHWPDVRTERPALLFGWF